MNFLNYKPLNFTIMKRSTLFKAAMSLVALLVSANLMAQTYPANIKHNEDPIQYSQAAETILQTTGLGLTLYVAPDPVYSPNYDGSGDRGTNLNPTSQWKWVYGTDFGTGNVVKDWANENWVVLTAGDLPTAGNSRTFWVMEQTSCIAATTTAQSKTVQVVGEPDGTMLGANTGSKWSVLIADREFYTCDPSTVNGDNFTLTFTETGNVTPLFKPQITVTRTAYDLNDNVVDGPADVTTTFGVDKDATTLVPSDFVATPTHSFSNLTYYNNAGTDYKTKYVFTLKVASLVSTLSHLRQDGNKSSNLYYTPTATQTVTYWLYLPPKTGPIYHIPNSYNF